ncbi:2-polyprenyl-3-methyl-6-methoxy-1,4-benzoquinone monooxygenase [Zeimonas sediminis]|uniref:2-polyprenyl-3-methyl-6-methoxy-1,4-benzoquinone monooxygenase n=1 Tax=Zeimonas sediminis TaxID=2944268 RepID=UPI002342E5A5|nr:2-polyprenyl-3-methyl-6-methoxy-1,4-benzoquinone monooxygenase [Zeimonas sediminis]
MSANPSSAFRRESALDRSLAGLGRAMATLADAVPATRPNPAAGLADDGPASPDDRRLSGALMRVNHVGEVCAQALYEGQAATTSDPALARQFRQAAVEEGDHLAWTRQRLDELGARPSLLNPLWYAGAFALGMLAGRAGDRVSLGFMAETERQVEEHLAGHMDRLPADDRRSRLIVDQMKEDEVRHAEDAMRLGGAELPLPVRLAMRMAARVMTGTAHYL